MEPVHGEHFDLHSGAISHEDVAETIDGHPCWLLQVEGLVVLHVLRGDERVLKRLVPGLRIN